MKINNKLLAVILALGVGVNLLFHHLSNVKFQQVSLSKAQLDKLTRDVIDIQLLQKNYNELSSSITSLDKILLKDEIDVANFVLNLEQLASSSGTRSEILLEKDKTDSGVSGSKSLGINLNLSGKYVKIANYLMEISRLTYLTRISGMVFSPSKVTIGDIDAQINMEVFTI